MAVVTNISPKLVLFNNENNFIEKEPGYITCLTKFEIEFDTIIFI